MMIQINWVLCGKSNCFSCWLNTFLESWVQFHCHTQAGPVDVSSLKIVIHKQVNQGTVVNLPLIIRLPKLTAKAHWQKHHLKLCRLRLPHLKSEFLIQTIRKRQKLPLWETRPKPLLSIKNSEAINLPDLPRGLRISSLSLRIQKAFVKIHLSPYLWHTCPCHNPTKQLLSLWPA